MSSLSASDIAWHLRCYAQGLQHEWITPNAMLYAWESDLLTVTRDGLVCEVEIKISRQDLLNDLRKPKHSQGMLRDGAFMKKTNGRASTRNESREDDRQRRGEISCRRPNYFCFAMPCSVYRRMSPGLLPAYAGVYTVDDMGRVFEERRAVQLHAERIAMEDLLSLARKMHHRYWEELRKREPKNVQGNHS